VDGAAAVLEAGGDNYSLDYGRPLAFLAMDRAIMKMGIPVVIWGASVGPFDKDPDFKPIIMSHLQRVAGIFVREPMSLEYLRQNGVEANVHQVADPAFLMDPVKPVAPDVQEVVRPGTLGINLSPLVARYLNNGDDLEAWRAKATLLVAAVANSLRRPVLLVPHVGSPLARDDDFVFLESVRKAVAVQTKVPVDIVPHGLDAAQYKWVIARCTAFAGARTHATIAALSSSVPTLSLSYSVKALGLNEDLFGHREFCQSVFELTPDHLIAGLSRLLKEETEIRAHLDAVVPNAKKRALSAGRLLRDVIDWP
jgi:polysaccharide pyruvyl transferase WcaK-like protein